MSELVERALKEHLCKDVDGATFYLYELPRFLEELVNDANAQMRIG